MYAEREPPLESGNFDVPRIKSHRHGVPGRSQKWGERATHKKRGGEGLVRVTEGGINICYFLRSSPTQLCHVVGNFLQANRIKPLTRMMETIKDQSTTRQHQPTENQTNKKEENPPPFQATKSRTAEKEEEKSTGDLAACLFF